MASSPLCDGARFATHLALRADMPFSTYLHEAVFQPLGMADTVLAGSPAHHVHSSVEDLLRFARELLAPTLIARETLADATRAHFPELKGALPGIGSFDPLLWGLTFEIKVLDLYNHGPHICRGLKRSLILERFRTAGHLVSHLESLEL